MSECKKTCGNCAGRIESILSKDRCDMTRNTIENYSNTCNHWEPNRETEIVMQLEAGARAAKLYNEKHGTDIGQLDLARGMVFLMEQNDELQAQVKEREREIEQIEVKCCACHAGHIAQVAVLRGSLETATDYLYNPFEPDNQCAQYKNIKNILQTTPAEAAERAKAIEQKLADARDRVAVLSGCLYLVRDEIDKYGSQADLAWLLESAKEALSAAPAEAAERVQKLAELLQDAVSETDNAERLSKGFCSAAKAALSEWRRVDTPHR